MTTEQVIAFFLFSLVAAITPGPNNVLMVATGTSIGILRGLPCLFGVTAGMGLMMFLVTLGIGNLVLENPWIVHGLKWGGVGFLLWLSWKIATADRGSATAGGGFAGFWTAAVFQWVNPKSWLVSTSAASTYLHFETESAFMQSLYFGLLFAVAVAPCCFLWLAFGASLQRFLHTERIFRIFNITMGALLAGSIFLFIL